MEASVIHFDAHVIQDMESRVPRGRIVIVGEGELMLCTPSQDYLDSWGSPVRDLLRMIAIGFGIFAATIVVVICCRGFLPEKAAILVIAGVGISTFIRLWCHTLRYSVHRARFITPLGNLKAWRDFMTLREAGKSMQDVLDVLRQQDFTMREFGLKDLTDAQFRTQFKGCLIGDKHMTSTNAGIDWFVPSSLVKTIQSKIRS